MGADAPDPALVVELEEHGIVDAQPADARVADRQTALPVPDRIVIEDEVSAAQSRLSGEGLATATEDNVTCCYAVQDKVWVDDPDGAPWEVYTVLADAPAPV